jgi:hypothetical protein
MYLHIHSDASYLLKAHTQSHVGGTFFLSSRPKNDSPTPPPFATPPSHNGSVHTIITILAALFHNARDGIPILTSLIEMCHPQAQTPIQTDTACVVGITNETVKQRRSKAIAMHFHWIQDRIKQGRYLVHWRKGPDNLSNYFTKHHSPAHHRFMLL